MSILLQAELDEGVLRKLARTAAASLNPMAAMFGGVVGQEVSIAAAQRNAANSNCSSCNCNSSRLATAASPLQRHA